MKAVILAGGFGTRISEETVIKPKPMIEIGGRPILWHIMKIYSHYGINDFIICLGYKGYMIKEYFANYFLHTSDVTIHLSDNRMDIHRKLAEPWRVTLIDTGDRDSDGGRLKRVLPHLAVMRTSSPSPMAMVLLISISPQKSTSTAPMGVPLPSPRFDPQPGSAL